MRRNFESPMESENNLKIGDYICNDEIDNELKRWTVLDRITNKIYDISDCKLSEGLSSGNLKLRGQFIEVENKHKIWIDAIFEKIF